MHGAGRRNGQDMKWLQEVRRMGTTADKVAAMTLLLQESAVSNLRSLDELLRWVSKRSGARAVAGQVCALHLVLLHNAAVQANIAGLAAQAGKKGTFPLNSSKAGRRPCK